MTAVARWIVNKAEMPGAWHVSSWQAGRPYYPDVSYKALVDRYQGWVYACANINAINCAQIPLRLYVAKSARKTKAIFPTLKIPAKRIDYLAKSPTVYRYVTKAAEVEEVLEHPFIDLMRNVNEFRNEFDLKYSLFLHKELTGNAYWKLVLNSYHVPTEIWALMPQYMKIVPDKKKFIAHYEYRVSLEEPHKIKPEELIHFLYPNPKDAYYGLGPLQAAVVAADLHSSMNIYETTLMKNQAQPDMALILPKEAGEPSEKEQKRMYTQWRQRFGGPKKAGKIAIVSGGAELKPLSLSPKEMAFLQGRKATLNEIAAIFGVPMSKLTCESVNRANADAGDAQYMKNTILPRLRIVEQKLNERLLPLYDERLFCAFDNPVPQDMEFRLKERETNIKIGFSSVNEERQRDGIKPAEWGDRPYLPETLIPVGGFVPEPEKAQRHPHTKSPRTLPPLNHPTNFVNQPLVRVLQRYFRDQGKEILAAFDKQAENIQATRAIRQRYQTKVEVDDFLSGWFDLSKWDGVLIERMSPFVRYTLMSGGERALRSVISDRQFDPLAPQVMTAMERHRAGAIASINGTKIKELRATLAIGIVKGEGVVDLRERIQTVYQNAETYDAERIARTETIWAWNEGAVQGYIQSGIVERKEWLTSEDERTCQFCSEMDGKIVGIEAYFFDKGSEFAINSSKLSFDYEDVGHPPLHPQCRCTIIPVLGNV